jgi:Ca2+-binding EF-hand superfamily protein
MKTKLVTLCSAILLSTAFAASAEDADKPKDRKDRFATLDADSDGQLSKEEVAGSSALSGSFTMIDRNSDGFISEREFRRNTRAKSDR